MSDFEDDVLNSDGDLDYEVCEEDEEALLADDQARNNNSSNQVVDARERIQLRKLSTANDEWEDEEEDEDNEGRGRFLSERAPNPQVAPSRPREDIPDSLEQVKVPESEVNNKRPPFNNFHGGRGRGGQRGGRFFNRGNGNFRGRGGGGRYNNNRNIRNLGDDGMRYHDQHMQNSGPPSAPTKILINPHFKGPRPLLSTPAHYPEPEEPYRQPGHFRQPPPMNNQPPPEQPPPNYQQFNPPLLPPPQPYHEPPRPYLEQPPPYNPPPPQRQPPPLQEWGPPDPYYSGHQQHQDFPPPHRQPPQRQPLLHGPPPPQHQQFGGPPPLRGQFQGPPHRLPPPPLQQQQHFPPYQQGPPQHQPLYTQPPPQQYQQMPPPLNYPPPSVQPPYMQGPPPPIAPAPYYDHHAGGPPPNMYSAPPPTMQPTPLLKDDFRTSIFLTERLERRRRSRSRSRSPLYERYSRRSRSRSYSPPRRYRDEIRRERPRRLTPEPFRKSVRQYSPPPHRRKDDSPPPRKPSNPEEAAYMKAIEKQKQERETVLKMKAIKRKLEVEKKKRDGDKDSPEKTTASAAGPSKELVSSPKKAPVGNLPPANTVVLKPKIKVIKKLDNDEEPVRRVSLITSTQGEEPLVTKSLNKNGEKMLVRRILTSKKDLPPFHMDSIPSVSSVLRGAEGPTQNKPMSKKMMKKSVVITKAANQAGYATNFEEERTSILSHNKQMRLATNKSQGFATGVTVIVENISSATKSETLKKMGLEWGLKKIAMKRAGNQQAAHMVFSSRENAEQFVNINQRKVLDLSVIDLKVL